MGLDAKQLQEDFIKDSKGTTLKLLDQINQLDGAAKAEILTNMFGLSIRTISPNWRPVLTSSGQTLPDLMRRQSGQCRQGIPGQNADNDLCA